jgi:FkbM family methyltransferase
MNSFQFSRVKGWIRRALRCVPGGKDLEALVKYRIVRKKMLGGIAFKGSSLQDMVAYLYFQGKRTGFFIDIGANDGIIGSNSYVFEKLGWQGICVEPQPDIFLELKRRRKCECLNVAIASQKGEISFFKSYGADALSGSDLSEERKARARAYGKVETIQVQAIPFDELMKNHPEVRHIDFLTIDVEGHELDILKTIDFSRYSFGFLAVERNDDGATREFLRQKGYQAFMEVPEDTLFIPCPRN